MHTNNLEENKQRYLNPYFGGVLLGLLVLLTVFITGRGLGASGSIKSAVVTTTSVIAPAHALNNDYNKKFISDDNSPMYNWLVFESFGILLGGLLSGILFGRVKKFRIDKGPKITNKTRLIAAVIGGILFGFESIWPRLHKWRGIERKCYICAWRCYSYVYHFWFSISFCLVC